MLGNEEQIVEWNETILYEFYFCGLKTMDMKSAHQEFVVLQLMWELLF